MDLDALVKTGAEVEGFIDSDSIPHHVAIIMDGNRRWAQKFGLMRDEGHYQGVETLREVIKAAVSTGVKVLTVYTFSTENWNRPQSEIDTLMHIIETYLIDRLDELMELGVRVASIGDLAPLPSGVKGALKRAKDATAPLTELDLVLAINYGGRDDLRRATQKIARDVQLGKLAPEDIDETCLASYLDTAPWPDPDLLIRTSGESRVSNFLLWQISYAEVVLTDTLWPEYTTAEFIQALKIFQSRTRRRGT